MDRYTRRELKQDEYQNVYQEFERFAKTHYKQILGVVGALIVVAGIGTGLKLYMDRQEAAANADLGAALQTFHAYVGPPSQNIGLALTFTTAREKYKKALTQFSDLARKYPRQKAGEIARYHIGVCQSGLGDHASAIKTLEAAEHTSDANIAALAKLALAGEYASTGKLAEAEKLYQDLADHPTLTVPKATALMALASADRASNPAKSRQIYEGLLADKDLSANNSLVADLKEQLSDLPK